MSVLETTIVRVGNSLGSRYKRADLDKLGIKEGDRVTVTLKKSKSNNRKAAAALRSLAEMNGVLANLDVEKWEAERDRDHAQREKEYRDILGR